MLENEDYYEVQVWNTQVGAWMEVASFATADNARNKIEQVREQYPDNSATYSIVHFTRQLF